MKSIFCTCTLNISSRNLLIHVWFINALSISTYAIVFGELSLHVTHESAYMLPYWSQVFGQICLGKQCRPRPDCSSRNRVYTVCNSLCIVCMHFSKETPSCLTFRVITINFRVCEILGFLRYSSLFSSAVADLTHIFHSGMQKESLHFVKLRAQIPSIIKTCI